MRYSRYGFLVFSPILMFTAMLPLSAQATGPVYRAEASLPDNPQPNSANRPATQAQPGGQVAGPNPLRDAPRFARYIEPDQRSRPLSATDKLEFSIREQVRPYAISTQVVAAVVEQGFNSDPKYGTDATGFGERLGAAAIRQDSTAIFSDGVLSALLGEDPRYYVEGTGPFLHRALYSATRILITRTDAGGPTPNYARLIGGASAYGLTMAYYPSVSATWSKAAKGYGFSILTGALGNELHEFRPDVVRRLFGEHPHHYRP